jgi:hypothetical protein
MGDWVELGTAKRLRYYDEATQHVSLAAPRELDGCKGET